MLRYFVKMGEIKIMNSSVTRQICTSRLVQRLEIAHQTMAFRFEKPVGLVFRAGQFVEVGLINPPQTDAEGDTRAFSLASAPHENTLLIATRMRDSAFKRVLKDMPLDHSVKIAGPFGDLVLHNNSARPAVLLAGGIGITPFRSMVLRACHERLSHRIVLFYSNRRPEDAAFLDELQNLERENHNYKLVATMTQMWKSHSSWRGETGVINREMLSRFLTGFRSPIYYLAGPSPMVSALRTELVRAGIDEDDIRMEEFTGY